MNKKLKALRKEIDIADRAMLSALAKRFKVVKKMGELKKINQLPIVQKNRWNEVVKDRLKRASKLGVSQKFTLSLLKLIHRESKKLQKGK